MSQYSIVTEYSFDWTAKFDEYSKIIRKVLKDSGIAIHYIGSTAVMGLKVKPIIDSMPVVINIQTVDALAWEFEKVEYEYLGEFGISGSGYLRKGEDERTYQIHIFEMSNKADIERYLAVGDYLRTYINAADEYGTLKEKLANDFTYDMEAYCNEKEIFMKRL